MRYDIEVVAYGDTGLAVPATSTIIPPDTIFGANLRGWWDAADGLNDKSTAGFDLTDSGTTSVNPTGFNGYPGWVFDTTTYLSNVAYENIGANGAIFLAAAPTDTPDGGTLANYGDSTAYVSNLKNMRMFNNNPPVAILTMCNTIITDVTGGFYVSDTPMRLASVWSTPTFWTYIDNVATDGGANAGGAIDIGNNPNANALRFGIRSDGGSGNLAGIIAMMAIVNVTPSPAQMTQMDDYIKDRFGL